MYRTMITGKIKINSIFGLSREEDPIGQWKETSRSCIGFSCAATQENAQSTRFRAIPSELLFLDGAQRQAPLSDKQVAKIDDFYIIAVSKIVSIGQPFLREWEFSEPNFLNFYFPCPIGVANYDLISLLLLSCLGRFSSPLKFHINKWRLQLSNCDTKKVWSPIFDKFFQLSR